ncbi:hypothetical protein [Streptomyces sp. PsTaAH-124]|uniref:hypothetical protein n=1 Tax=Streptomyces sp. PsTaAH-124 TaxID=1157638 RepID=UPI00036ED657|nr:hypothetical protein [Streptomyces sp. PsTaAH-124]
MGGVARLRVPVGEDAERWITRTGCRRVLFIVHNVTSATRLLDTLPLFDGDLRVQLFATCTGSSPFLAGVPELLTRSGLPVLPWAQAKDTDFDLAITASYGGELDAFQGKLVVLSHGVGYNKRLAAPHAKHRAPVFGMSPDWLLQDGRPLATATVLSHPEQVERLNTYCPEAAPTAVLAGDPCYDRILAALPRRDSFRRALGVGPGQRLIVLNSTWSSLSLFGATVEDGEAQTGSTGDLLPWLLSRLAAELPVDEYRVTAVLHPNIWYGHGPGQLRAWLAHARQAGLDTIPPLDGWRQALIAADCVIGDHGSVTYYAASIGVPVLLGTFPEQALDPLSPVAALGRAAPRIDHRPGLSGALRDQIDHVIDSHKPDRYRELAAQTSSSPGESGALLRHLFYRLMDLPEPTDHPALLAPLPLPPYSPARRTAPIHVLTQVLHGDPPEVEVVRRNATSGPGLPKPRGGAEDHPPQAHTVVDEETEHAGRLSAADIVVQHAAADDPRIGPPEAWTTEALARYPSCGLAVYTYAPDRCVARTREGTLVRLTAVAGPDGRPDLCEPAVYASALYALTSASASWLDTAVEILVRTGEAVHRVTVDRLPHRPPP